MHQSSPGWRASPSVLLLGRDAVLLQVVRFSAIDCFDLQSAASFPFGNLYHLSVRGFLQPGMSIHRSLSFVEGYAWCGPARLRHQCPFRRFPQSSFASTKIGVRSFGTRCEKVCSTSFLRSVHFIDTWRIHMGVLSAVQTAPLCSF